MTEQAAILLAGGRGSRMGGINKTLLEVGGTTLLDAAITAAHKAGCERIVAVGEQPPDFSTPMSVVWVREDPPFGGPVAGILSALPLITEPLSFVLACDLPAVAAAVRLLVSAPLEEDGVCLLDGSGRRQWLTGLYRTDALRTAAAAIPRGGQDAAVRSLLGPLRIAAIAASGDLTADIDTWDDLNEARRRNPMSEHLPPEALDEWAAALRELLGLGADDLPIPLILDLARDVATGVARPAAPLSAFAAGLAAGRAGGTPEQVRENVAEITAIAKAWHSDA